MRRVGNDRGYRRVISLATAAASVAMGISAHAQSFRYVATTEAASVARTGAVRAGTLTWQCAGNRCTVSGPWKAPAVSACKALASEVGRLRSYGRIGAELSAAELKECNRSAAESAFASAGALAAAQQAARAGRNSRIPNANGGVAAAGASTQLVAETVAPARAHGAVRLANGDMWNCSESRCTADGGVTVARCFVLAHEVGRIRSVAGPGGSLSAAELRTCNAPGLRRINFAARSGDDDLRENSELAAEFTASGGGSRRFDIFHKIPSHAYARGLVDFWDRHAVNFAAQLSIDSIETMTLVFKSGRSGDFDTQDNWDMVELEVRAIVEDVDGRFQEKTVYSRSQNSPIRRFSDGDRMVIHIGDALRD